MALVDDDNVKKACGVLGVVLFSITPFFAADQGLENREEDTTVSWHLGGFLDSIWRDTHQGVLWKC